MKRRSEKIADLTEALSKAAFVITTLIIAIILVGMLADVFPERFPAWAIPIAVIVTISVTTAFSLFTDSGMDKLVEIRDAIRKGELFPQFFRSLRNIISIVGFYGIIRVMYLLALRNRIDPPKTTTWWKAIWDVAMKWWN